jgi:cytochrome c-type biogenesis protein CcmE
MAPKRQRLILLGVGLAAMAGALALGVSAVGDSATYFYAPADVADGPPPAGRAVRLGGLVEPGSLRTLPDGLTFAFRVTDGSAAVPVEYRGLKPDLFREGSGIIATGSFDEAGTFRATTLLARHDENYMPPEVAEALRRQGVLRVGEAPASLRSGAGGSDGSAAAGLAPAGVAAR